ncbi:hypothetical protein EC973_000596 [Apophysomyces ossiformis]|uniref:Major facilitator superfamily (MFS) profile domain-containing protein n=1 Tax=Apophysomyces ossiformis TaxID=679940 RepID=A0A8H7BN68_9FUNG|nr:hypothetical protein EC973_000596 [Apophysomyces ossiformis]
MTDAVPEDNNNQLTMTSRQSTGSGTTTVGERPKLQDVNQDLEKLATRATTDEPYTIFSPTQLIIIVVIVSYAGMLSSLSANIYFPALPAVQKDMHTTTELVNLTVTTYMIFQGLSPAFWGSLADVWGRRPVYLITVIIYTGACIGLALAPVYWLLLVLRMLQAFGSSSTIAIGAGVVGDIAIPSKRGTFFGMYTTGQFVGPIIGPVLGGIISQELSWRWNFWLLLIIGATVFIAVLFFVPETLRSLVGNGSGYANPTPSQWIKRRLNSSQYPTSAATGQPNRFLQPPNVTRPFRYFLQLDLTLALLYNALHYTIFYCYLTSTPELFQSKYSLSELQVGLCFLCQGVGCVLGSIAEGKILDRDFRITAEESGIEHKKGAGQVPLEFPIYKARLRTLWIGAGLMQIVTLIYGWCIQINAPLAVALVLQFLAGYALTSVMTVFQTLLIDLLPGKGASITASINLSRCLLGAVATVVISPGIQGVGAGWMFTILALILIASNSLLYFLMKYGPQWRERRAQQDALQK